MFYTREALIILASMGKIGIYFLEIPSEYRASTSIPKKRLRELHKEKDPAKAVMQEMKKYKQKEEAYIAETLAAIKKALPGSAYTAFNKGWMICIGRILF